MSIYRGAGGAGDAVADSSSEALLIRELVIEVQADADSSAASATAAASSATAASGSATAAAANAASVNLSSIAITGGTITGITDLAVADGGTGASTAANARTNLGVTATGTDTTYAYRANNLSDLTSASTARTNLGVSATGADTTYAYRSNNLSDLTNVATSRTNLGLGTIATQNANSVAITGGAVDGTTVGSTTRSSVKATTLDLGLSTQSVAIGQGNASLMKNRIINGAMVIDQRNAGASVTPVNQQYTLDRWLAIVGVASKYTIQQNAGSVTPPAGFINYLGATSTSAYSVTAGDVFGFEQRIEGLNTYDLAWGTANAKSITVSFWAYSSLTGNFGGVIRNNANTRSYPFLFSISSANTWTQISVTIPGDTSGTWLTNNLSGVKLTFNLGCGSTYSGTAGSWASAEYYSATGATSVVGTSGATFYITGVQLEVGSSATGYEYRQYQQELALCQRYFFSINAISLTGQAASTTVAAFSTRTPVTMRTSPTCTYQSQNRLTNPSVLDYSGTYVGSSRLLSADCINFSYTQSSGSTFTANIPIVVNDTGAVCTITGSAEL